MGGEPEREGLVHVTRLPAREAATVGLPDDLPTVLRSRLEVLGIPALYAHQAEALATVRAGRHVVVATGTASGKSLCYQLPTLEALLADERSTALYLAPTKALARDQLRAVRRFRLPQVRAAAIDGDTPGPERDAIRRTANWVLTNPDLLHHSLLPGHQRWADFLHRLQVVIVDESHTARGVFGGHVALVLRRLRRLCERYDATPRFVLASATIGNPGEHARALTGLDVEEVVVDGSPRGALALGLWQPPFEDAELGTRRSLLGETADVLASFVGAGTQTLVFTKSRKAAEVIALIARQRLVADDGGRARQQLRPGGGSEEPPSEGGGSDGGRARTDLIRAYRAGYLPEERRALEESLRRGEVKGMVATEALELGIDVAGLDAVVLAGYPGTAASFWQRLGRAGRGGAASAGVLVAAEDPLDQYLVGHPAELIGRAPEDAIVDPSNPYLLGPHLRCACQEAPMSGEEAAAVFDASAPDLLAADVEDGVLRLRGGRHYWTSRRRASAQVSLRSVGGASVRIVDADTGVLIGDVDEERAHRQVHGGAVYLHQGLQYEIAELDLDRRVALAHRAPDLAHTTRARSDTDVRVLAETDAQAWADVGVRLGRVEVTTRVTGYDVLRPGGAGRSGTEVLDRIDLDLPPATLETVAVWYVIPSGLLTEAGVRPSHVPGALHAAEHAAIGILPLIALCDRWDVGGLSTALHPDTGAPSVFVYDGTPGGAGLAERSFLRLPEHLSATRDAVAGCRCHRGCPSCVQSPKCGNGNEPLDKDGAVRVLEVLLARAPRGGREPRASQRSRR